MCVNFCMHDYIFQLVPKSREEIDVISALQLSNLVEE